VPSSSVWWRDDIEQADRWKDVFDEFSLLLCLLCAFSAALPALSLNRSINIMQQYRKSGWRGNGMVIGQWW